MAGPASGMRGVVGSGEETIYGTPVAVDRRHPMVSEAFQFNPTYLGSEMMDGEPAYLERAATREENTRGGTGQLVMDVPRSGGFGRFLEHAIGGTSTIAQQGVTTAWLQTHTFGSVTGKSLTIQKVLRAADGTVVSSHRYHGCKITGFELSLTTQARPRMTFDFDFEDEEVGFETTTVLGLTAPLPGYFSFKHGALLVDSVAAARVTDFTLSMNNNLSTEDHFIGGSGLKAEPEFAGNREITGSITYQVLDLTSFYNLATGNTGAQLDLQFLGPNIESTFDSDLIFTLPEVRFEHPATPQIGGPGVVTASAPWRAYYDDTNPALTATYQSVDVAI